MSTVQKTAQTITFKATLSEINSWIIVRLPKEVSAQLPSRGQVMIEGTINGADLQTPLEPDGRWGHWFRVEAHVLRTIHASVGDVLPFTITPIKDWPEPIIPADLRDALLATPKAYDVWQKATPMAHWEWLRWIRSTNNQETHMHRVEVAISKLTAGERRPCCWNRNLCTEPAVSKNGMLLEGTSVR